jgi:hypothetical protein
MNEFFKELDTIVNTDRSADYGDSNVAAAKIVNMFNMLVGDKPLSHDSFYMLMIIMKLVREQHKHKRDNCIDICGYAYLLNVAKGDK